MSVHCRALVAVVLSAFSCLGSTSLRATEDNKAGPKGPPKINEQTAANIALARVPGGKIKSSELEREHGKLVWSFDIVKPRSKDVAEVQVDADSGEVVAEEVETPADQAREAAADRHQ